MSKNATALSKDKDRIVIRETEGVLELRLFTVLS